MEEASFVVGIISAEVYLVVAEVVSLSMVVTSVYSDAV